MPNNFLHNCGNIFVLVKRNLTNPSASMQTERLEEHFGHCNAMARFILPMSVILTLVCLLSYLLWYDDGSDVQTMVYSAIVTAISPFVVFYVIRFFSVYLFSFFGVKEGVHEKSQVVTLQLMLLFFSVNFICIIIPDSALLNCIYVYAFYMLWFMGGDYLGIADNQRVKFMFFEMILCAIAYILLPLLLMAITPKHP